MDTVIKMSNGEEFVFVDELMRDVKTLNIMRDTSLAEEISNILFPDNEKLKEELKQKFILIDR